MVRTWPAVVDRVHAMVRARPALVGRVHQSRQLLGQVMLLVLLAVTMAFSWRDGARSDEYVYPAVPLTGIASVSGNNLSGKPHSAAVVPVTGPAAPDQPPEPTAPPVLLQIPRLDVHRPVEAVGMDQSGVMNLPVNAWNAGWFRYGPVPGASGDAVIEGHSGYPRHPMIFAKLASLRKGDRIIVVLSDGSRRLFLVVSTTIVPAGSAPPGLADPYGPPRLTLVTCTGHFDYKSYESSDRLLLEARYAGLA
jgi:LPXTG-site transpeptidase (sortase) family protein